MPFIQGSAGEDSLYGDNRNDTLDGGADADLMVGNAGDDVYLVNNENDLVWEYAGEGNDTVISSVTYQLTYQVENLTLTGLTASRGTGNNSANILLGNAAANTLEGLEGDDTLDGKSGDDTLVGGTGNDLYIVNSGQDQIMELEEEGSDSVQSSVSYALSSHVENLLLMGLGNLEGTGNEISNLIAGNDGSNVLYGMEGNDTLDGGLGNDWLIGGTGDDTYVVDSTSDRVTEDANAGIDTIQTNVSFALGFYEANVENLTLIGNAAIDGYGNSLDNVLTGNSASNRLQGGFGNDTLVSGGGQDTLSGGQGDDTYVIDSGEVAISENYGEGNDTVVSSISWELGYALENLTLTGTGSSNAIGNADNNILNGNSGNNLLDGSTGADSLLGGSGNDTLYGRGGDDVLSGGSGDDSYIVDSDDDQILEEINDGIDTVISSVSYALSAHIENLVLSGTAVTATGNDLANTLTGNAAGNTLDGGSEVDTMSGGAGDDTYFVDSGDVVIELAGEGLDTVVSSVSHTLSENVENLTLSGSSAINATGNILSNYIVGNTAANLLDGGLGNDTMSGGAGNDTYRVDTTQDVIIENSAEGIDTVLSATSSYQLGANLENLVLTVGATAGMGNALDNSITGNEVDNFLGGGEGDDTLDGGNGKDMMIGGRGNDFYVVDNSGDSIVEQLNEGIDTVQSSISYQLGQELEHLTLTGFSSAAGLGNSLNNVITGNSGDNNLVGDAGNDSLNGGAGGDQLDGGIGDDSLNGEADNDYLFGGSGNDTLDGGSGEDQLVGGEGSDTYIVDNSLDLVIESENEGTDIVFSSVNYSLFGRAVENLVLTGSLAQSAHGNDSNNALIGNTNNNTLFGYFGDDTIDGGLGSDTMLGGAGNDTYAVNTWGDVIVEYSNEGTDTVLSTLYSYTLTDINIENITLTGALSMHAQGNDRDNLMLGNSNDNTLEGRAGDDTLNGGAGFDQLYGGQGNDTYIVDNDRDIAWEYFGEGTDTVFSASNFSLSENIENLTLTGATAMWAGGNSLHNVIVGNSANNSLNGLSGNDTLDGSAGIDTLHGGTGNDTYLVNDYDYIYEYAGEGTDTVQSSRDYTLGSNLENLTLTGSTARTATGNELNNILTGNAADNVISGGSGNDTLDGGAGNDSLDGGTGVDSMSGGTGNDMYVVDSVSDVVTEKLNEGTDAVTTNISYTLGSNVENLILSGGSAISGAGNSLDNKLTGNTGNNALAGNAGNDTLDGGAGIDTLTGGVGDDTYVIDSSDVIVEYAGEGSDTVVIGFNYTLGNNLENLTLSGSLSASGTGNAGNNVLIGNSGNNVLSAQTGNDTLDGAGGMDTLVGGSGNDTYLFGRGASKDTISEADGTSGSDLLQFGSDVASNQLWFQRSSNNLLITIIGTTDQVVISNWYGGTAYHVEQMKSSDGKTLLDSRVDLLVNAMASFAPPPPGQTTLSPSYQNALAPALAAAWQ
ncbi:MAG: calcium-binding protein [Rhodocyclaceae bacterium]